MTGRVAASYSLQTVSLAYNTLRTHSVSEFFRCIELLQTRLPMSRQLCRSLWPRVRIGNERTHRIASHFICSVAQPRLNEDGIVRKPKSALCQGIFHRVLDPSHAWVSTHIENPARRNIVARKNQLSDRACSYSSCTVPSREASRWTWRL